MTKTAPKLPTGITYRERNTGREISAVYIATEPQHYRWHVVASGKGAKVTHGRHATREQAVTHARMLQRAETTRTRRWIEVSND